MGFCLIAIATAIAGWTPTPSAAQTAIVSTMQLSDTLFASSRIGGITMDELGFLYVSNFREAVWRVSPRGQVKLLADNLYGASGNAIDRRGDLLQANHMTGEITRITREGVQSVWISDELVSGPVGIAVNRRTNQAYVSNCWNNSIVRIDPDRTVTVVAEGDMFACPNGITVSGGRVFVVNFDNEDILEVFDDDPPQVVATVPGGGNAHIVVVGDSFYVTKHLANKLYRVSTDGSSVEVVAGTGELGLADGPGDEATLSVPNGLVATSSGTLFMNNVRGVWRSGNPTSIVIRRVDFPPER
jgi:DNA-binding beta-propeller fold protein YncE